MALEKMEVTWLQGDPESRNFRTTFGQTMWMASWLVLGDLQNSNHWRMASTLYETSGSSLGPRVRASTVVVQF